MLVGAVYGATGAGLYHLGKRVAVIVARLGEPLQQVVYPELARLWATGDRPGFRRVVFLSSAAAAAGSLIIITIILFLSDEIVVALAGHDYILSVHIFVYALYMSGVTLVPGLLAMGRQMDVLKIHLLGTGVFYIVVFPSLLAFGPAGASAAHISFNLVWLVASYVAFLVNSQRQPFGAPTGARLGP
jgi:O-antigen/teichoic acid export membrane protein